jgi:hypothetical protein
MSCDFPFESAWLGNWPVQTSRPVHKRRRRARRAHRPRVLAFEDRLLPSGIQSERTRIAFLARSRRCTSIRARCAIGLRVGSRRRVQVKGKDRPGNLGLSRSMQIQPVSGCQSSRPLASGSTGNDRRTAPMACGREKWGRLTACSMRSASSSDQPLTTSRSSRSSKCR